VRIYKNEEQKRKLIFFRSVFFMGQRSLKIISNCLWWDRERKEEEQRQFYSFCLQLILYIVEPYRWLSECEGPTNKRIKEQWPWQKHIVRTIITYNCLIFSYKKKLYIINKITIFKIGRYILLVDDNSIL
jgi:hypothetical protein